MRLSIIAVVFECVCVCALWYSGQYYNVRAMSSCDFMITTLVPELCSLLVNWFIGLPEVYSLIRSSGLT